MNIFSDEWIEIIKEAFIMGIDRCNTFIKSGKKMKDWQAYWLFNDRWDHWTKKLITKEISDFGGVRDNLIKIKKINFEERKLYLFKYFDIF